MLAQAQAQAEAQAEALGYWIFLVCCWIFKRSRGRVKAWGFNTEKVTTLYQDWTQRERGTIVLYEHKGNGVIEIL
jgi:hypothetical protein